MDAIKCEAFLLAADHGSLTTAAEILGYSQPGITRMIRSLEEELGFEILQRSTKGVVPTENGKIMIPVFREIVRAHQNAQELQSEIQGLLKGTITIGTYFSVSAAVLPPLIRKFETIYPEIKIQIREGYTKDLVHWMDDHMVDFCFAAKPVEEYGFEWIHVLQDENMIWLPHDHPRAKDHCYPVMALQEEESFIQTMPGMDTDHDMFLKKYHIEPNLRFSTADAYSTYCMVDAGLGVSMNQRIISQKWNGNVVLLPFDPPQYVDLGIFLPSLKDASIATKKFIELVKNEKYII